MKKEQTRLSTQGIFLILGRASSRGVQLLNGIFLTRLLDKAAYGTFTQVNLFAGMFGAIFGLAFPRSSLYFVPQLEEGVQRKFLGRNLLMVLLLALLAGTILIIFRVPIANQLNNPTLIHLMPLVAVVLVGFRMEASLGPILVSTGSAKLEGLTTPVRTALNVGCVCIPAFLGYGLNGAFYGLSLALLAQGIFAVIYVVRLPLSSDVIPYNAGIQAQLRYVFPLSLSIVVVTLGQQMDKVVMAVLTDPAAYAVYARGAFEVPLVTIIPYALADVLMPKYVQYYQERNYENIRGLWHESIRWAALVILPSFVYLLIFGEILITFLFTEAYRESALIFRIYLFILPLRLTAYGPLLLAAGKSKEVALASIILATTNIILNPLFYLAAGPTGLAAATVVATLANISFLLYGIKGTLNTTAAKLMPWRPILKIFLVSLLPGLFVIPLTQLEIAKAYLLAVSGVLYTLLYLVLILHFRLLNDQDRLLIARWLPFLRVGISHEG